MSKVRLPCVPNRGRFIFSVKIGVDFTPWSLPINPTFHPKITRCLIALGRGPSCSSSSAWVGTQPHTIEQELRSRRQQQQQQQQGIILSN